MGKLQFFSCPAGDVIARHDGVRWTIDPNGTTPGAINQPLVDHSQEGPSPNAISRVLEEAGLRVLSTQVQVYVTQTQHEINHPVPRN